MSQHMTRHRAVAGMALLIGTGAKAIAQPARSVVSIRIASSPNDDLATILYAQNAGLFRNAGIEVTIQKANNGSAVAAAVIGGAFDIGKISAVPIINAHVRGVPLVVVFPNKLHVTGRPVDDAVVVAADSPIRTARDLNGKIASCSGLQDSSWIGARAWIDVNGGDSSSVRFIEIPFSLVASALEAGRIQAGSVGEPYLTAGVKSRKMRFLGDAMASIGKRYLQSAWSATAEYATQHRDVVARFASVVEQAARYCNAHQSESAQLTAAFTGLDATAIASMQTLFATESNPSEMQPWIDASVKYNVIPQRFDARELYLS